MSERKLGGRTVRKWLLFFSLIFSTTPAWSATYYVAKTGDDSRTTTQAQSTATPWLTIQKALDNVAAGDTVNVFEGVYSEALVLKTTGTSGSRITVTNYGNGKVTISSGNSRAVRLNGITGYYTFRGLRFTSNFVGPYAGDKDYSLDFGITNTWWGYGYPVDSAAKVNDDSNGNNGFIIEYCDIIGSIGFMGHNNIVRYCNLDGNNGFTNAIQDITIVSHHNQYIYNTITRYTQRAIWTMTNTSNITASYNHIYNWGGTAAIDFDGAWLPVFDSVMEYNVIHDGTNANSMGMQFENGMNCIANGNIIYNVVQGLTTINYAKSDAGGGYAYGYYDYRTSNPANLVLGAIPYASNNIFSNNIVYRTSQTGLSSYMTWGTKIYNNTFDSVSTAWGTIVLGNSGTAVGSTGADIRNNIISNSGYGVRVEAGGSIATQTHNLYYNNTDNGTIGTNTVTTNPLFVGTPGNLYKIQAGSPAKNAGATLATVTTDYTGYTRSTTYDIGAYEIPSSASCPPCLSCSGLFSD